MKLKRLIDLAGGMFTWMITGYLAGMLAGFIFFEPEQDLWAVFGLVFALAGLLLGLTRFFQRHVVIALGGLMGFYLGAILGVLLWGNLKTDDLLEVLHSPAGYAALAGALLGGWGSRLLPAEQARPLLLAFVFAGFLGGFLLGVVFGLAPYASLVGWSPFVIGSGFMAAGLVQRLRAH